MVPGVGVLHCCSYGAIQWKLLTRMLGVVALPGTLEVPAHCLARLCTPLATPPLHLTPSHITPSSGGGGSHVSFDFFPEKSSKLGKQDCKTGMNLWVTGDVLLAHVGLGRSRLAVSDSGQKAGCLLGGGQKLVVLARISPPHPSSN